MSMTYFGVLLRFIIPAILLVWLLLYLISRRGKKLPPILTALPARFVLLAHILVALIYTTPWDNYLVATRVWWYDPALVTGFTLGWVPVEEYTFFILQSTLSGSWLILLAMLLRPKIEPAASQTPQRANLIRLSTSLFTFLVWLVALWVLIAGWQPGNYLALILIWALPPIMLQLGFGADILWRLRRLALTAIISSTLYLSMVDSIAIVAGTWTINPEKTLNVFLAGILPIEEFTFFLMTNILLVFGMILVLATPSQSRAPKKFIYLINKANKKAGFVKPAND